MDVTAIKMAEIKAAIKVPRETIRACTFIPEGMFQTIVPDVESEPSISGILYKQLTLCDKPSTVQRMTKSGVPNLTSQ